MVRLFPRSLQKSVSRAENEHRELNLSLSTQFLIGQDVYTKVGVSVKSCLTFT